MAFLGEIISTHGAPERWLSDNGKEFTAGRVRELFDSFKSHESHGLPYKPSTQGAIERAHQPLKSRLDAALLEHYQGKLPSGIDAANALLQKIVQAKNSEYHFTTRCIPLMVSFQYGTAFHILQYFYYLFTFIILVFINTYDL